MPRATNPLALLTLTATIANAGIADSFIEDQVGATFVSGGYTSYAAQSFTPSLNSLAAIEISIIGTAALTADVTLTIFTDWNGGSTPESLSGQLASKTLFDVPRSSTPLFVLDQPIQLTPEQTYYFLVEPGPLAVGSNRQNEYDRGQVIFGGGNISGADLFFTTYAVPAPTTLALLTLATPGTTRRRR
jgi:hypothetical protein